MDTHLHITRCQFWPLGNLWKDRRERNWFWRFYYNEEPGAGVIMNDRKYELAPDVYLLIPPGRPFSTWQHKNVRQFYIHFDTLILPGQVKNDIYTFKLSGLLKEYIYAIDEDFKMRHPAAPSRIQTMCLAICGIALASVPPDDFLLMEIPSAVQSAMDTINANVEENISIEQLADQAGLSANSLIRLFKKHIGTTPYQYLTALRIEKASRLLLDTELSIDKITAEVGYNDRFHFSRLFKNKTGTSPGRYRQNQNP